MKKIATLTAIVSALTIPMSALAGSDALTLTNKTDFPITSLINKDILGGACSSSPPLGKLGVIEKGQTNNIDIRLVKAACSLHQSNCTAEIHFSENCGGDAVGVVTLNTSTGIQSVQMINTQYKIEFAGFTATISPRDAVASR